MQPRRLTFACELDSSRLTALFADGSVIADSPERAAVVRQLNAARSSATRTAITSRRASPASGAALRRRGAARVGTNEGQLVGDRRVDVVQLLGRRTALEARAGGAVDRRHGLDQSSVNSRPYRVGSGQAAAQAARSLCITSSISLRVPSKGERIPRLRS